jgi:hypothetical protein
MYRDEAFPEIRRALRTLANQCVSCAELDRILHLLRH